MIAERSSVASDPATQEATGAARISTGSGIWKYADVVVDPIAKPKDAYATPPAADFQ
jgi:hypothetical protein